MNEYCSKLEPLCELLDGEQVITVRSQVSGKIIAVNAPVGATVCMGDRICSLQPTEVSDPVSIGN